MNERVKKIIVKILIGLVAGSLLVWILWNWLMPSIFGLKTIHLGEAAGLFVMSRVLFGQYRFGTGRRHGGRRRHFREKWKNMSPEQRKEFIDQRKERARQKNKGS